MAAPAYTFHAVTDVGRGREQNEDSCGEVSAAGGELLVVCDGMGGHESGEVASRIAVDAIMQIFQNSPASDPSERLKNGFLVANQRILAHAEKAGLDGMGTTAVAAFVRDGEAWIGHVGDSRAYHLRGGSVLWRTADHTRVQKMIDRGILTPEQAKTHEDANVVTRALGFARGEEQPEPDIAAGRELRDGDLLLLCSDGLYDLVKDEEIAELGSEDTPAEAAQRLVDLATRRGGHDNITVTIMRWGEGTVRKGGPRKTDLDDAAPSSSAMKTTAVAKEKEKEKEKPAAATATEPDARSKKAAILVIGGLALVGIAAAVFFLTRGDSQPTTNPARDAGTGGTQPGVIDAAGGAVDPDGGAAGSAPDGGTLTAPVWDQPKSGGGGGGGGTKKGSGAGSGSGSGSGAGSGAGSGNGAGSGSAGATTGSGSGSAAGSQAGAGFATKLGAGRGSGSGASAGSGSGAGSGAKPAGPGGGTGSASKPSTGPGANAGSAAKPGFAGSVTKPPAPKAPPSNAPGATAPSTMPTTPPGMTPPTGGTQ